jgi:hypothetical protein
MTQTRLITLLALASGVLSAQAPIFSDGAAFGGSRVFSEGLNPLGNSARFDKPATGTYLGWVEGDEGAKDTKTALEGFADADKPWASRTRAFGITYVDKGMHGSLVREETTSLFTTPDLDPAHAGAGRGQNLTSVNVRRSSVDRIGLGAGSFDQGSGYGILLRIERWKSGQALATFAATAGGLALDGRDLLDFKETMGSTKTSVTLDLGYTLELLQGVRFGATVDRLIPRHFGDVYEGTQARAGFQLDLGGTVQLSVDSDINEAMRMPLPVRQRISTASLRMAPSRAFTLIVGAERRDIGGQSLVRGGVTLFVHGGGWHIGAGFQAGQDRPMKGLTLSVS